MIIASSHYLIRIGIKALIHHLGIEPEYHEFRKLIDIPMNEYTKDNYLIVHHKLLGKPKSDHLSKLIHEFNGKVLLIGDDELDLDLNRQILLPNDSETIMVEKLQNFFSVQTIDEHAPENSVLSAREIDILKEVAQGYSNKEIADRLFISINTVITHRKNLTEKLGIKTISGLTVYALMNKLINPEDVK